MRNLKLIALLIIAGLFSHCDEDLVETHDPNEQRTKDLLIIEDYAAAHGYSTTDTTRSGTRYHIIEAGTGASIDYNDLVSYFYSMSLTDDTILITNNRQIAIDNDILDSARVYESKVFTYTQSTDFVSPILSVNNNLITEIGFKEGLIAATGKMNVGGHAVLMIPSGLMYQTYAIGPIPANSVIIMHIYLTKVRPQ